MKYKTILRWLAPLVALTFALPLLGWASSEMDLDHASAEKLSQIVQGGLLYDKWYKVVEMDAPKNTHPSYAKSQGKKKGSGTWRCKECHGWDYMGKDGAYKKGSHFSGIAGIRNSAGGSKSSVKASLKGSDHGLGKYLSESALDALAAFVVEGQLHMDDYIDRGSKKARGDIAKGKRVYLTVCKICHGDDGKSINFKSEKKPEYVGTVARKNPWEALHKIRMGQPGEEMFPMLAFPVQLQVDVLAFAQTLPAK